MIRDAETSKAHVLEVPGTFQTCGMGDQGKVGSVQLSVQVDEDYLIVGNYIDDATKRKIGNGEYIDFAKLMPRDKVGVDEDHRMEMINRGGLSYWVPVDS